MTITALALVALVAVLTHQPLVTMERLEKPEQVQAMGALGRISTVAAYGWTSCDGGGRVTALAYINESIRQHELLHAVDCVDNGQMDGSPLPGGCVGAIDCPHAWVYWAEWHPVEAMAIIERIAR